MRKLLFLLPCLLLACSGAGEKLDAVDVDGLPSLTLRATGDISLPEPMTMAAFVPNHVAAWAGHILLLSESGAVWRTTSEGEPPEMIAAGPFKDIYGLSRPNKAGVFLALGENGKLSAFMESDNQGNYKPLAVSQSGADISGFCEGVANGSSWVIGADNSLFKMTANAENDAIVEVSAGESLKPGLEPMSCYGLDDGTVYFQAANGEWDYTDTDVKYMSAWASAKDVSPVSGGARIGFDPETGTPLITKGDVLNVLDVENGLSIRGLSKASFMATTTYPLGSVFNEGVILLGEKDTSRMVIISMEYAKNKLAENP